MLKTGQERSDLLKVTRVCKTCWHLSAFQKIMLRLLCGVLDNVDNDRRKPIECALELELDCRTFGTSVRTFRKFRRNQK